MSCCSTPHSRTEPSSPPLAKRVGSSGCVHSAQASPPPSPCEASPRPRAECPCATRRGEPASTSRRGDGRCGCCCSSSCGVGEGLPAASCASDGMCASGGDMGAAAAAVIIASCTGICHSSPPRVMKASAPSRAASARTHGAPPRRNASARPLWSVLQLGSRLDRSTARASAMRSGAVSMSQCGGHPRTPSCPVHLLRVGVGSRQLTQGLPLT